MTSGFAASICVTSAPEGTTTVVIDTGPDFRAQMIAARVETIDAVLYTAWQRLYGQAFEIR